MFDCQAANLRSRRYRTFTVFDYWDKKSCDEAQTDHSVASSDRLLQIDFSYEGSPSPAGNLLTGYGQSTVDACRASWLGLSTINVSRAGEGSSTIDASLGSGCTACLARSANRDADWELAGPVRWSPSSC